MKLKPQYYLHQYPEKPKHLGTNLTKYVQDLCEEKCTSLKKGIKIEVN